MDKYYKPISKYYDEVIGTATADFVTSEALLNLVCEGMRFASKSDIAIYNTGGIGLLIFGEKDSLGLLIIAIEMPGIIMVDCFLV